MDRAATPSARSTTAAGRGAAARARARASLAATAALLLSGSALLSALDTSVAALGRVGPYVRATIEVRDLFTAAFRRLLHDRGTLHLRLATTLWEDRPGWDRLVIAPATTTFRLDLDTATETLVVTDPTGATVSHPGFPDPLPLSLDVAPLNRIADDRRYYLKVVTSAGPIAQQELDSVGEAVFGERAAGGGFGSIGRLFLRKMLELTDYLQSETGEVTSRKVTGREIRENPVAPERSRSSRRLLCPCASA